MNDTTTSEGLQALNCLIVAILESFVATVSSVINGLLLIVLYKNPFKSFRRPFSILIIGLVTTDFLKGLLADSMSASIQFHCAFGKTSWLEEDWNFYTVLDYMLDNSATILIILFAGDRLLAVSAPLYYRNSVTAKKTAIIVLSVWLYALFFSLLQFSGIKDETYDFIDCFLHIVIPMVFMIVIHISIYCALKSRRKIETAAYSHHNQGTPSWIRKNKRLEKNFRFVTIIITMVLAISQLPWLSLVILEMNCTSCKELPWFVNYNLFASFTLSITSAINPVLYCWRLKQYRRALKALVTCKKMPSSSILDSAKNEGSMDLHVNSKDKKTSKQQKDTP